MVDPSPADEWFADHADLDTSGMAVIGPLKMAVAAHEQLVGSLFTSADVSLSELELMLKLRLGVQPTIAVALARTAGRSPAAVSKTLAKLTTRGLVAREPNPADRRAALVRLTEEGTRVVDEMFPRQVARESAALAGLGPRQRQDVVRALELLASTLRRAADA